MGADSEALNQWTPAPALTEPDWTREGEAWVARSANGRFVCTVTHNGERRGMPWNYTNRFDGAVVANFDDMTEEGAKRRALGQLAAWRSTKPNTTEDAASPSDEWRWNGAGSHEWRSPCGRVKAMVWHNTHGKDWRWTADSPSQSTQTVGNPAPTREDAQALALDTARRRIAELDAAPVFTKADASKPRTELLPPHAMLEVARVLGYGAAKYSPGNHLRGGDDVEGRYMGATLRHLFAHMGGEANDGESGMPHLAHAAANLLLLLERAAKGAGK